jgi:hypothetical protein
MRTIVVALLVVSALTGRSGAEEEGLRGDPNIDRAWLSPTAATQPQGTWSFNDWELVLVGITYGVTNSVQLSAAFFPPFVQNQPFAGFASLKVGLIPEGRVRLSGSLSLGIASDGGDNSETHGGGLAGGVLSLCTDDPCASLASVFVFAGFALGESQSLVPIYFGGSLVQRLSEHVKLSVEVDSGGWLGSGTESTGLANGALVTYGVRFFGHDIAVDVGLIRPFIFYKDVNNPFVLGYPMVAFSYRWGG